jgi:hypothetical protein
MSDCVCSHSKKSHDWPHGLSSCQECRCIRWRPSDVLERLELIEQQVNALAQSLEELQDNTYGTEE